MRIAVIGDKQAVEKMKLKATRLGLEWIWFKKVTDISRQFAADAYIDLEFSMEKSRIDRLSGFFPQPVLINSVIHTLQEIGQPFIRFNGWPGFLNRAVIEISTSAKEQESQAKAVFDMLDWPVQMVADVPGMISARVIAMIINEAYFTFQEKISSKEEIDIAMKIGTNYPFGPFEWSKLIGLRNIYELLLLLGQYHPRYRIAKSLELEVIDKSKSA
jgi:3-hydroxybutyryl-CoA dehydrogenase